MLQLFVTELNYKTLTSVFNGHFKTYDQAKILPIVLSYTLFSKHALPNPPINTQKNTLLLQLLKGLGTQKLLRYLY